MLAKRAKSATLSLWTSQDLADNDSTVNVYRLKVPFDEMQATWNVRATGSNWQVAGASGSDDRESAAIGSVVIPANDAVGVEKQISLDPAKMQEYVSGAFVNNGFVLAASAELNDRFMYRSSDYGTASQRPKLVIQYTLSDATPVPSNTPTITPTSTATATPTITATPRSSPPRTSPTTATEEG